MSRFKWHIARKNEMPKVVRHYKHITKMFAFILRNPAMFRNKNLTIYNHGKEIRNMTWIEIAELMNRGLKEREVRKIIRGLEGDSDE